MKPLRRLVIRPLHLLMLFAVVAAAMVSCSGCAGLAFSGDEMELLEASAADARFMDRTWDQRSDAERREFARENALRWTCFNHLVHGRKPERPVTEEAGDHE